MIKLLLVTSPNNPSTAFWVAIFNLLLATIPCSLIRTWIYSKAFYGFGKSNIKKIKKKASLLSKLFLLFLFKNKTFSHVKKRIAFYWFYLGLTIVCIVCTAISWKSYILFRVAGALFFFLRAIDVIIWINWSVSGRKIF